MKKVAKARQIKQEIDSYELHFVGFPLVIGIDDIDEYVSLLELLNDDFEKQIIRMSDSFTGDYPPEPLLTISVVSSSAKYKSVIWLGAAQAKMLYGQNDTEQFLINLLGANFKGPVTVLCPFCGRILENIGRNYEKLGHNIIVVNSAERTFPTIHIFNKSFYLPGKTIHGIKSLIKVLEDSPFQKDINIISSCEIALIKKSMFPVIEGRSAYQILCELDLGIASSTKKESGSEAQWEELLNSIYASGNLSSLCESKMCSVQRLSNDFGLYLYSDNTRFLCFICLKVLYGKYSDYLAHCLEKSVTVDEFESNVFNAILDIERTDTRFIPWLRQRRVMLSSMEENHSLMKDFCEKATIKRKDILWYLSDHTESERVAIIHALSCYQYSFDELNDVLPNTSSNLWAYIQQFTFDEFNTKVISDDGYVRKLLSDYFHHYKLQKIMNRTDADFVKKVEEEAKRRSFTKLQARSSIVKKLDKNNVQAYFIDALGAEFLSFIQSRAEYYGMNFTCFIGHCNLPSITSKNKEFFDLFPEGTILPDGRLDKIKHEGIRYDFRVTSEPVHIFDELLILDDDLKKMRSALAAGKCERIIIFSDHGSSRLAVTYRSENDKLELSEPGQHSGRCCPSEIDPCIPFVTHEGGFAILANYERFKGSRKADVETHGGASLEETVVPVILLQLAPQIQQIYFVDSVVTCSPKNGSSIRLFSNPPLKKPILKIECESYSGRFDGDKRNVVFDMPDIRRKGRHVAMIYDGAKKITELSFETRRQTGTNQII